MEKIDFYEPPSINEIIKEKNREEDGIYINKSPDLSELEQLRSSRLVEIAMSNPLAAMTVRVFGHGANHPYDSIMDILSSWYGYTKEEFIDLDNRLNSDDEFFKTFKLPKMRGQA